MRSEHTFRLTAPWDPGGSVPAHVNGGDSRTPWLNPQPLCSLLACLGNGDDGVGNVYESVGTASECLEILEFNLKTVYHLL